jgi:transposase
MKTVNEHNRERRDAHYERLEHEPDKAGVTCPMCRLPNGDLSAMVFSDFMILTSFPAQRRVHCPNCGHAALMVQ